MRGYVQRDDAQVDQLHLIDKGNNEEEPWTLGALDTTQAKDDAAFVLRHNFDRRAQEYKDDDDQNDNWDQSAKVRHALLLLCRILIDAVMISSWRDSTLHAPFERLRFPQLNCDR